MFMTVPKTEALEQKVKCALSRIPPMNFILPRPCGLLDFVAASRKPVQPAGYRKCLHNLFPDFSCIRCRTCSAPANARHFDSDNEMPSAKTC